MSAGSGIEAVAAVSAAFLPVVGSLIRKYAEQSITSRKIKKLAKKGLEETDMSPKGISSREVNPLKNKMNCGICCLTEELRRRGNSFAAKDISAGITPQKIMDYFVEVPKESTARLSFDCVVEKKMVKKRKEELHPN